MLSRRHFTAAAAALIGGGLGSAARAQRLDQDALFAFQPLGQVTLLHFTDCHAQLLPIHFREPSINLGVGESAGLPPHLVGRELLQRFAIAPGSAEAFALAADDFAALARNYGRLGGMDRMATAVAAIRAERPGRVLLLDGGDTWQGSYTALATKGADMVAVQKALGVDAMTGHWEFTHGQDRVKELAKTTGFPFLAGNVKDATWNEDVFDGAAVFERGGVKIAVIGQAFPYTPIANPRHMMADWSFGIEEERLAKRVTDARAGGADLVVLLSHNGFDVDRKLARRVRGIDVILTGHTHDALPAAIEVEGTLLIASGSHGKFLSRLDLDVQGKRVAGYRYRLIPLFAEAIRPDPAMAALIARLRAPHAAMLGRELGRTDGLLYRRGNFNGTFDDLICQAMLAERDAEIALSPGFRWGNSLLPGEPITVEDIYNLTAITYPACYRAAMTGAFLKEILEDVADNLFHPDPYYQQGGDMVRVGGLSFTIDPKARIGQRIQAMTLLRTGEAIDAARSYTVAGWASVNEATEGPPIWDVAMRHIERVKTVRVPDNPHVRVVGL